MAYGYITLAELRGELLDRLQDSGAVFTPVQECNTYIVESLRVLNAQVGLWNEEFEFSFNPGDAWKSINVDSSPRQQTVTDSYLYSQMEAMLMEPMTGGVWTGTNQYNIELLSSALQYRRDELLLQSAANVVNLLQPSPVTGFRTYLPDSTLNLHRVRWVQYDSSYSPYALGRGDILSRDGFGVNLPLEPGEPDEWRITSNTPLSFDVSCTPNQVGEWDMLVSYSGVTFAPPAASLVGLPNDWTWVAMYGALADVLSNAPEGRDAARAKYCLQRYEQGKKAMTKLPWLISALVNGVSVDTPGFIEIDTQEQNWEQVHPADDPQIVVGGIDFIAIAPFATDGQITSVLTVIGNAPVPVNDSDQIQISRDGVDAVLNYAQHIASFKMGGKDFALTVPLFEQFEAYCRMKNSQYAALGIFRPDMLLEGNRNDIIDPRFEAEKRKTK